jgi:hypothetical protein
VSDFYFLKEEDKKLTTSIQKGRRGGRKRQEARKAKGSDTQGP